MKNWSYTEYSVVVNRCLVVKVKAVIIIIRVIKNVEHAVQLSKNYSHQSLISESTKK